MGLNDVRMDGGDGCGRRIHREFEVVLTPEEKLRNAMRKRRVGVRVYIITRGGVQIEIYVGHGQH